LRTMPPQKIATNTVIIEKESGTFSPNLKIF
jgi:hypothetical protein